MIDRLQNLAKLKLTESDFGIQLQSFTNSISLEVVSGFPELISGTVINFNVNPVEPTVKLDMFNRYYLSLGNPNPLSGIL